MELSKIVTLAITLSLFAFLAFWCVGLPFRYHSASYSFAVLFTIGEVIIFLITLIVTVISCHVFHRNTSVEEPQAYLIIVMMIADLLQMFLFAPSNIGFTWLFYDLPPDTDMDMLHLVVKCIDGTQYLVSAISILSFTFFCLYRMYVRLMGQPTTRIPLAHKFIITIVIIIWSFVIAVLNYVFYFQTWEHIITTVLIYIIPCCLMLTSFILKCFSSHEDTFRKIPFYGLILIFASYLVLWGPFKIAEMMRRYCCELPNEHAGNIMHVVSSPVAIKCFTTPFILLMCFPEFRSGFFEIFFRCHWSNNDYRKETGLNGSSNNNGYIYKANNDINVTELITPVHEDDREIKPVHEDDREQLL